MAGAGGCSERRHGRSEATLRPAASLRDTASCTARMGKLYRARSRLYRSQILQVNMRSKALAEIFTMRSFAQLCNLIILQKAALRPAASLWDTASWCFGWPAP